jgi:hypothetical protein
MDFRETGWGVEWTVLAQDRNRLRALVNAGSGSTKLGLRSRMIGGLPPSPIYASMALCLGTDTTKLFYLYPGLRKFEEASRHGVEHFYYVA